MIACVAGQNGSFLAELLLAKGYEGAYSDVTDSVAPGRLLEQTQPDEIDNLAGQSHAAVSFELPEFTADVSAVGVLPILEALRMTGLNAGDYQASSSEMSGSAPPLQNEQTPFHTRSPYGISKVFPW